MKYFLLFFVSVLTFTNCQAFQSGGGTEEIDVNTTNSESAPEILPLVTSKKVKNVIFIIGDGTGLAQITAGQYNMVGPAGRLYLQTMPVTGIVKTFSSSSLITDSAAGATAFSCGIKTYNGAIGLNPERNKCKTIPEFLRERGYSTGLVATSSITHATPASFASHVESRSMANEIASQLVSSGTEVMLGGGLQYFLPQTEEVSERLDERNLIVELKNSGYQTALNRIEFDKLDADKVAGLFAADGLERRDSEPGLQEMTQKAIEILSKDDDGFFLMVEGSQIDWGGHRNDAQYVLREMKDFDAAVKTALDFAVEDGETLVILTADHETGGMTLQQDLNDGANMQIYWTSGYHTGTPVPLMAYGPQALEFMGWRDNTYIGIKLAEILGITDFPYITEE